MIKSLLYKNWIKWLLASTLVIFVLIVGAKLAFRKALDRNNISYSKLEYHFPSFISIEDLHIDRGDSLQVSVGNLETEWRWISLLRKQPDITRLVLDDALINFKSSSSKKSDDKPIAIPKFTLKNTHLTHIIVHVQSNADTLGINLDDLRLTHAGFDDQLILDSLLVHHADILYHSDTSQHEQSAAQEIRFSLDMIPLSQINHISITNSSGHLYNSSLSQKLSDINFIFSGWKKNNGANFSVDRLGLTYQDTLDLQFILENGTVNNELHTRLENIDFRIPGLDIQLVETELDFRDQLAVSANLNRSYVTVGTIRKLAPAAAKVFHPDLPGATRVYLEGILMADKSNISTKSFSISLLDSTKITMAGDVSMDPEVYMDLHIEPLETSRSNLEQFLSPEEYHQFFHWPVNINGHATIIGPMDSLVISGMLDSHQGRLGIYSNISSDNKGNSSFELDLSGDSLKVGQITPLVPIEVPMGQIHFNLSQRSIDQHLDIQITSDWLSTLDREIRNLQFALENTPGGDKMTASINDEDVKIGVQMRTPAEKEKGSEILVDLQHLDPEAFNGEWPEGSLSASLSGNMITQKEQLNASFSLQEVTFNSSGDWVTIPDSKIDLSNRDERIEVEITSNESRVLYANTGKEFPPFAMPLNTWFARWPSTEAELSLTFREDIFQLMTGNTGSLVIEDAHILKDSTGLNASLSIPEGGIGNTLLTDLAVNMNSTEEKFAGRVHFGSVSNPGASIDSFFLDLGYAGEQYEMVLEFNGNDTASHNYISMLLDKRAYGYNLRFNEADPLLISDQNYQLTVNDGVKFSRQMKLMGGDLGIGNENMQLNVSSADDYVTIAVDSFKVFSMLRNLASTEFESIVINGLAELNTRTGNATWNAEVLARHANIGAPARLRTEGIRQDQQLSAEVMLRHPDINAVIDLLKEDKHLAYSSNISKINTEVLEVIPKWPEELKMSGNILGKVSGTIQPGLTANGYLIADRLNLSHTMISTPVHIPYDTIVLADQQLNFSNLQFTDNRGSDLLLNGAVGIGPDPDIQIDLTSENFTLLNAENRQAQLRGNLKAGINLNISGNLQEITTTGDLVTPSGGSITYRNEKNFTLVDASDIVTFMDLDATEEEIPSAPPKPAFKLDADVALSVNNTNLIILLDEINGEYIEINGSGNLRLRMGPDNNPLVFGTIRSTSGTAYIQPSPLPNLEITIEEAEANWNGILDEPLISFRGYETIKAPASGLSGDFTGRTDLIDFKVIATLDKVTLSEFDLQLDLSANDAAAEAYLQSLSEDKRQAFAINLLVFGRIGADKLPANSMLANQVTQKLNELARKNLKNTGVRFSSETYEESVSGDERERTDLNYAISRRFLDNRLNFKVGGSVGFYTDDLTEIPPSDLIGDLEVSYRISEQPQLILKGTRKNVYEGILDGMVTEESLGIYFQKSYPSVKEMFNLNKEENKRE